ncbi:MAG: hypothetical protein OEY49_12730, partial [Candidatus Heimdallarchaeota archaeon]|nr:hypothetical protein [Candidatus Heimdallarchaeota archaeon]
METIRIGSFDLILSKDIKKEITYLIKDITLRTFLLDSEIINYIAKNNGIQDHLEFATIVFQETSYNFDTMIITNNLIDITGEWMLVLYKLMIEGKLNEKEFIILINSFNDIFQKLKNLKQS